MRAYYFTSSIFAISNIALRRIKIARLQELNDPFELLGVNLADITAREKFRKMKDDVNKKSGLICFSKNWNNPLLWGHYSEKHTGVALGFDINDEKILPVIYADKLMSIDIDPINGKANNDDLMSLIRTKFKDWKYENEVRMFVELDENRKESGLYFEPFTNDLRLREVILGPKCELSIKQILKLVDGITPKVDVIKSRIAFTRFEVLENKKATRLDKKV